METVMQVTPKEDFSLIIQFNTGEVRRFDMRPYLDKGIFQQLQDYALFKQAYVALDTVCWPGNLDVAPETLYDRSIPFKESTLSIHEPNSPPYGNTDS